MQGKILHTEITSDKVSCWSLCQSNDECTWFSYENVGNDCILFETCPEIEENQYFISSKKNCQYQSKRQLQDNSVKFTTNYYYVYFIK